MALEGFELKIVTPDGAEVSAEVKSVLVRTTAGDVGILKNHTNYVATIDYGLVKITYPDGTQRGACCMNGFVSVDKTQTRIIATTFEFADEIDLERAQRSKESAEARLAETGLSEDERALAESRLKRAKNRIRVYELNH
ncbi:MAG: ATP synthase F1 subunit epsilon [Clostridia bacterium]|nr:ATP synthase F1 subunit epsilon [Clostridia bacterium]